MVESRQDGRRLRAERSREAVIDAVLELYDEGVPRPSAAEIAERAGVSERSVFRHFDDLEALAAEAIDRQFARVAPFFAPPETEGTLAERVAALVDQRVRLHGRMANMARGMASLSRVSPTVAAAVDTRRTALRQQVGDQFDPELDPLPPRDRRLLLAALDTALSLESIDYLRTAGAIGPRDLRVVLTATVHALLASVADRAAQA
jgi:AcrR family transcriptional regulator